MRSFAIVALLCALIYESECKPSPQITDTSVLSSDIPSALSNIELLIPLSLKQNIKRMNPNVKLQAQYQAPKQHRDRDEPYSSIPAYAFKLDNEFDNFQSGQVPQNRASFLGLWPRASDEQQKIKRDNEREALRQVTQYACMNVRQRHGGGVGNMFSALCTELIDELAATL